MFQALVLQTFLIFIASKQHSNFISEVEFKNSLVMTYFISLVFTVILLSSSLGYGQSLGWKEIGDQERHIVNIGGNSRVLILTNGNNDFFRSEDTGKTWQHWGQLAVKCKGTSVESQHERMFVGFGFNTFPPDPTGSDREEGVYRTDDNGRSWQRVLRANVLRIISSESMVIAIIEKDFLYSTNAGATWKQGNLSLQSYTGYWWDERDIGENNHKLIGNSLFVTRPEGLVRIVIGNSNQPKVDTLLKEYRTTSLVYIKSILSVRADRISLPPNVVFTGSYTFSSSDTGTSWKQYSIQFPPAFQSILNRYAFYHDANFVPIGDNLGLQIKFGSLDYFDLISYDNGQTWKRYQAVSEELWTRFLSDGGFRIIKTIGNIILIYSPDGLYRIDTKNCTPSEYIYSEPPSPPFRKSGDYAKQSFTQKPQEVILGMTSRGDTLYANTYRGIFRSTSNGLHWERIGFMNDGLIEITSYTPYTPSQLYNNNITLHKSHFFALSWGTFSPIQVPELGQTGGLQTGNRLLRLPQDGYFWKTLVTYPFNTFDSIYAISSLGNNLVAAMKDTVYYSTNNGDKWQIAQAIPRVTTFADDGVRLFAGTEQNGIYFSNDSGRTWQPSPQIIQGKIYSIIFRGNTIFAASDNGIWRSLDNGNTWFSVNEGLSSRNIRSITTTEIFVIALDNDGNIFLSPNDGDTWKQTTENLNVAAILQHGNSLLAYSKGFYPNNSTYLVYPRIFQAEIPQLSIFPIKENFSLVRPNPVSETAIFAFDVETKAHVSLTVYDMLGRTTAVIVDNKFSAGPQYIDWDVTYIASGSYFYRLIIDSKVSSGRFVIVK